MPERLFSTNQIANLLGVTPGTVGQWIKQGWLPHKRLPEGSLRISEKHLVRFLKDRGVDIEKVMAKAVMRENADSSDATDELVIEAEVTEKISLAQSSSDQPKQLEAAHVGASQSQAEQQAQDGQIAEASASAEETSAEEPSAEEPVSRPSWVSVAQLRARAELEGKPFDLESIEAEIAGMTSKNQTDLDVSAQDTPAKADKAEEIDIEEIADSALAELEVEAEAEADSEDETESEGEGEPAQESIPISQESDKAEEPDETDEVDEVDEVENVEKNTQQVSESISPEPQELPESVSKPVPEPLRQEVADRIDQIGDAVLADAIDASASAIHLQAGKDGGSITIRVGGVLVQRDKLAELGDDGQVEKLIAYFTQEAKIDGSGTGSLVAEHQGRKIDLALTALPVLGGMRLTIRLLDPARQAPSLDKLGLSETDSAEVRSILTGQAGLTLVAGPDARATAQLLMAAAGEFQAPGSDVIYLVRKAETAIDGLTVCPIDPKAGFGFSEAVGSAAACDPDALCVGELCDPATAVSAFEAAQCGTPVLAGLTGASVAEVIRLLSEMGIEGWPLSMNLRGIILCVRVKELCPACKTSGDDGFSPVGCDRCGRSGYSGQKMLVSVAKMSLPIERALRSGASPDEIQQSAIASGMTTLKQAAGDMFRGGLISKAELQRTVGE